MAALGLLGPTAAEGPGPAPAAPAPKQPVRAARLPISGVIDKALAASVSRRMEEAAADGCRLLFLHITSDGGMLDDGMNMSRQIERIGRHDVRTVAYVDSRAYSAAAIVAFSCHEIVMSPEASLGACTPYAGLPGMGAQPLEDEVRAKLEGAVIERMVSLAAKHGYPPALLKAMVKMQTVVIEARHRTSGEVRYVEEQDLFALGPEWDKGRIIVSSDEVLTVGGEKARTFGLARHVVAGFDDLYDLYPIAGRVAVYPVTWQETVVLWLNNMYLRALLVLVGLLGIYVEMTTPGFGVPGTMAIVCFALLFVASFLAGEPKWLPLLLFVAGATMLAIELFVTPGFGLLGGLGIVLLMAGIVLALPGFQGLPERPFEYRELLRSVAVTAGVLVLFVLGVLVLARYLPHVPVLGRLVLGPSSVSDGSSRAAAARVEARARVGEVGRAATNLRPAGKVRFGDRLADAMTEGDFLDAGTDVEVLEVRGNRIVVAPRRPRED